MRAKFIYEKFSKDSDPIDDMGIGLEYLLKPYIKKLFLEICQITPAEMGHFDEWEELDENGVYTIKVNMDGYGMSDFFELEFIWKKTSDQAEIVCFSIDGMNKIKWDFSIKKSVSKFLKMTKNIFWDIYNKHERKATKKDLEEYGCEYNF